MQSACKDSFFKLNEVKSEDNSLKNERKKNQKKKMKVTEK